MISLCIATYNRFNYLKKAMDSIFEGFKDIDYPYEIVVADGGSTDGTLEYLRKLDDINLIEQGKLTGAIKAYNETFHKAKGDYIFGFNDDMVIFPEVIVNSCKLMDNDEQIGIVGPKVQETKRGNLHSILLWGKPYWIYSPKIFIIRLSVLKEIGYFDECFRTYYVDVDLPLTFLKMGYTIAVTRRVGIVHLRVNDEDVNIAKEKNYNTHQLKEEFEYLQRKWMPMQLRVEEYLQDNSLKKHRSLFFRRFCAMMYYAKWLRPYIEHSMLALRLYDWFLEQTVIFKDSDYKYSEDLFLAQRYPSCILR